jgi:hypothetical protein
MSGNAARFGAPSPSDPVLHELPPLQIADALVAVRLELRRSDDGVWRGRLIFGETDHGPIAATGEIFCAETETDLWESVHHLRANHLKDLYRSVVE